MPLSQEEAAFWGPTQSSVWWSSLVEEVCWGSAVRRKEDGRRHHQSGGRACQPGMEKIDVCWKQRRVGEWPQACVPSTGERIDEQPAE